MTSCRGHFLKFCGEISEKGESKLGKLACFLFVSGLVVHLVNKHPSTSVIMNCIALVDIKQL